MFPKGAPGEASWIAMDRIVGGKAWDGSPVVAPVSRLAQHGGWNRYPASPQLHAGPLMCVCASGVSRGVVIWRVRMRTAGDDACAGRVAATDE
jgi:hypothetical protein